jgi:ribosome-binding protein aMBF1 (putative translation factor)
MIQNERQYEVAQKKLAMLEEALAQTESAPNPALPPRAQRAGTNGMRALIGDMRAEVTEYEKLKTGRVRALPLASVLSDLPDALVRARIARGWTHKELAQALGTTEQQVQKDESGGYARASLERLQRVATALGVEIAGRVRLSPSPIRPASRSPHSVTAQQKASCSRSTCSKPKARAL